MLNGPRMAKKYCCEALGPHFTPLDMASAFSRTLCEGALDRAEAARPWRVFRIPWRDQYRVMTPDAWIYRRAEQLLWSDGLRA